MILIRVGTDDVAEEPQTPEHDRLGHRRLSRSQADFLVGDMGDERLHLCIKTSQDMALLTMVSR